MVFKNAQEAFEVLYLECDAQKESSNGTKMMINKSFTITDISNKSIKTSFRKWSESYAKLEFAWYLSGNRNPKDVESVAKIWSRLKDKDGNVNSNYGNWWKKNNQLAKAINLIKLDSTTRRAVVVHYDPNDVDNYLLDTPCNIVLNFHYLNGKLNMTVFARSIDLFYGFCNDQYCFARLIELCCKSIGCKPGTLHFFITNLHIYKKHYNLN